MNQLLPHLGIIVGLKKANWYNGRIVKIETKEGDRIHARMIYDPLKVVKVLPDNVLTGDSKDALILASAKNIDDLRLHEECPNITYVKHQSKMPVPDLEEFRKIMQNFEEQQRKFFEMDLEMRRLFIDTFIVKCEDC